MTHQTIRVGAVGTTAYAENHLSAIGRIDGAELVSVVGRNRERAEAVAAKHGASHVFASYPEMLDADLIDAVLIVAPDELHEEIAVAAFERGLHVLCEKPLARTDLEASRMAQAAAKSGLVNMSYFALRTTRYHRKIAELVAGGAIGEIRSAAFTIEHGFFRSDEYNWRFDATRGGGVLADLGCYVFDLARWYAGEITAVAAHTAAHVKRPHPDGGDYPAAGDSTVGLLEFESGAHGTFELSVVADIGTGFQRSTVHIQGSHGRIELTHTFGESILRIISADEAEFTEILLVDDQIPAGQTAFVSAIQTGTAASPSFYDGWQVQRVVTAAERAVAEQRWVRLEEVAS